jgi:hypothetical protein
MIKKIVFLATLFMSFILQSQEINLDQYQYIIVDSKLDFLKKTDQYQTSSLTKFLLQKKGFKVYLDNESLPKEVNTNRCLALFANVINESNMLRTKNRIQLKDCYGNLVYQSKLGASKIKEYKKAYQKAIRNAYETMEDFNYSYKPSKVSVITKEIVEDKIETTLVKKDGVKVVLPITKEKETTEKNINVTSILYAQPKINGFQLINSKPEVVFVLLKTNLNDVYILKDKEGVFYKKDTNWVAEYYKSDNLIQEIYKIKF